MDYRKAVEESTEKILRVAEHCAQFDKTRPEYHFHAPAQWMDDPNGIIYHNGYYHMMYSLNPDTDKWRAGMVYKTGSSVWKTSERDWTGGITVWGHARSRDLIHWEHLPIALYPDTDHGEYYIWFGCTAINDENTPVAIYTSIGYEDRNPTNSAVQFIAFGDDDLIRWKPGYRVNPIMTESLHHGVKIREWRDPFLFRQNGKSYLILGGKEDAEQGGDAVVLLYEAENKAFTSWKYKGVLFQYPNRGLRSIECPNLVRIGGRWVLFLSPHGPVEYFVGDLDAEKCTFRWNKRGYVDRSTHFYATNVLTDDKQRVLLWGAVEGFRNTSGWNGINSLPREISLSESGALLQTVPKELQTLRASLPIELESGGQITLEKATAELIVRISHGSYGKLLIGADSVEIMADQLKAEDHSISFQKDGDHILHIFVDKSMAEIFVDAAECFTTMIQPIIGPCRIQLEGTDISMDVWKLETDGLFYYQK